MATTLKQLEQGSSVTLMTTELNSLANGSSIVSSVGGTSGAFTNTVGTANWDGYVRGKIELYLASLSPSGGAYCSLWFIKTVDGTNYEDGASSTPYRTPDVVFPIGSTASTAYRVIREILVPVGTFKLVLQNSTGASLASSSNTVKIVLSTDEGV
jgi:hypothetical protein